MSLTVWDSIIKHNATKFYTHTKHEIGSSKCAVKGCTCDNPEPIKVDWTATKINDKPQPDWKILYALNLIAIFAFLSNNKKPPKGIKSKQVYLRYLIGDLVLKYLKKYGKPYLKKR